MIRETSTLVLASYVSATRGYVRSITGDDKNDHVDVNAANILDYMSERAKKNRILLVLIQYLRLVHETELLYKAEKNADIELFLVALKHISLACCVSHSTGYVKLLSDFFVQWTCASPALKRLYERAILFCKTVNGNNIFSDRLMEWIIRDFRFYVTKKVSGGVDIHLDSVRAVSLQLKQDLNLKAINRKEKMLTAEKKQKPIHGLTKVFCETLVYCEDTNLMCPGPVKNLPSKPYMKRKNSPAGEANHSETDNPLASIEGEPLNIESMFTLSTSLERDQDFNECNHIDTDDIYKSVQSEKKSGISLATISPDLELIKKK